MLILQNNMISEENLIYLPALNITFNEVFAYLDKLKSLLLLS